MNTPIVNADPRAAGAAAAEECQPAFPCGHCAECLGSMPDHHPTDPELKAWAEKRAATHGPRTGPAVPPSAPAIEKPSFRISGGGFTAQVDAYALQPSSGPDSENRLWFLSIVGPQTSVRAVRANLLNHPPKPSFLAENIPAEYQPKQEDLFAENGENPPPKAPKRLPPELQERYRERPVFLGDYGTGNWQTPQMSLPRTGAQHALLWPRLARPEHPPVDGKWTFLLLCQDPATAAERYMNYLSRRARLPLLPQWQEWLWKQAIMNYSALKLESFGIHAWLCHGNDAALHQQVKEALQAGELPLAEDFHATDTEPTAAPEE